MVTKLVKDALSSELSALDNLISSLDEDDFVNSLSLKYKRDQIASELQSYATRATDSGRVILAFDGGPVDGSRGIDAAFAARTLESYQDLIAKQVAAQDMQLSRTGPVPARNSAKMKITDIIHGSFGFQLEESNNDQLSWVITPVQSAISEVSDILQALTSSDEVSFQLTLARIDGRVFISIQSFFENLYRDSASLKLIETNRDFVIGQHDVLRARGRVAGVTVTDKEIEVTGRLLGLTPVSRRFDLRVIASSDLEVDRVLSGQVGQKLSNDYLERSQKQSSSVNMSCQAKIQYRIVERADRTTSESFTLLDLEPTT